MRTGKVSSTLADLLAPQATARGSGIVTATRGKLKRLLCLERGRLVYAVSNVIEEQFAEALLRSGVLGTADRAAIEREATRAKRKFLAVLRESAMIPEDELTRAMNDHVRRLTRDCLGWTEAQFRFDPGLPSLDDEVRGDVSVARIMLDHVARHPKSVDMVRVRIGPPDLQVRIDPEAVHAIVGEDDPTLAHVLEGAREPVAVGDLASSAPDGDDRGFRVILGLLMLRVLRRADTISSAAAARSAEEAKEVSREEIEGWIARSRTATHYDILGVPESADIDDVRAGYYRHARRLHPDRVRSGPHADLLPQVEEFFGKVTEAYNTLHDPDRRREYDRVLRETRPDAKDEEQNTGYLARQNFVRAKAALERRRLGEALSFLENAVRLDGKQAEYRRELGRVLATNPRRRGEAEQHLRRAIEIDPSAPDSYLALADLLARTGRGDEAVEALRETLRWDPNNEHARNRLTELGLDPDASV